MGLLGEYRDQDVLPDHSMVVVRDAWHEDVADEGDGELPDGDAADPDPNELDPDELDPGDDPEDDPEAALEEFHSGILTGTLVTAGHGWLWADAVDAGQDVVLELHDGPPPPDLAGWQDVAETPFGSRTGAVGIAPLTGGAPGADLDLGSGPGTYRVRIHRRTLGEDERRALATAHVPDPDDPYEEEFGYDPPVLTWRLQFWADPSPALPRRLLRLPIDPDPGTERGWAHVLDRTLNALLSDVAVTAGTVHGDRSHPVATSDVALRRQAYEPGGLDAPMWAPSPAPLPTGHRDLDEEARAGQALADEETFAERAQVGAVAAEVGLPAPETPREALDLLAALGLLTRSTLDGEVVYGYVDPPPPVQEVLRLDADQLARVTRDDDDHRWGDLAHDVAAVAMWHAVVGGEALTVRSLAGLLLLPEDDVREALHLARQEALLSVGGDLDDPDAALDAVLLPGRGVESGYEDLPTAAYEEDGGPPVPWEVVGQDDAADCTIRMAGLDDGVPMPAGAAPLAGYVADEHQLVLPGGDRVDLDVAPTGLWETRAGVLATHDDGVVLVRPGGVVEEVEGAGPVAVAEDGRLVALHAGAAPGWRRRTIQLLDPVSGGRSTLDHAPWDHASEVEIVAVHGGTVHLTVAEPDDGPRTHWTWRPGSVPTAAGDAVQAVDPWSGATVAHRDEGGVTVTAPGGAATQVLLGPDPRPVPGGRQVWTVRRDPPAVSLFDLGGGAPAEPARVCWLPGTVVTLPDEMVWEDEHHLLVPVEHPLPDLCVVRVDVRTGRLEAAVRDEYTYREVRLVRPYPVRG